MTQVSAYRMVPPFAQGLVRDLRVRWALEEAGKPYEPWLLALGEQKSEAYRRLQPFGQVPVYRSGDVEMFESGAIVLHIAEQSDALMPVEPAARARTKTWIFAALNSVEPEIMSLVDVDLFHAEEDWAKLRRPGAVEAVRNRLAGLSDWLGKKEYLEDRFTAGDLMMTTVLRILRHTDLVAEKPNLAAYMRRCEARPAFQKALADQMVPFLENAPKNAAE